MLLKYLQERTDKMRFLHAEYNMNLNSVDINTYEGYILRIECNIAEEVLKTTFGSQCVLNALVIDEPLEYARLVLEGNLQM